MRILVAGVGNLFLGDDGFGPAVARRLLGRALPEGVEVVDSGIAGLHLAYRLLDAPDLLLVVDLVSRGGAPGTLYVLEPETDGVGLGDAHGMDLPSVFASLRALGGTPPRTRIVGCEPARVDEGMELSAAVERAVDPAAELVYELLERERTAQEEKAS